MLRGHVMGSFFNLKMLTAEFGSLGSRYGLEFLISGTLLFECSLSSLFFVLSVLIDIQIFLRKQSFCPIFFKI